MQITVTYTAIVAPAAEPVAEIAAMFVPTNAAADLPAFDGTYYDTNVAGFGSTGAAEAFIANSIAHPGLVLALKRALEKGTYTYETDDKDEIAYLEEVTPAVADQGFTITITKGE